jgi:sialate O-acetylesterase
MRLIAFAFAAIVLTAALAQPVRAEVRLPALISDHMVVQRDTPVRLWGWADAGEALRVSLAGKTAKARAGQSGRWEVALAPLPAGGPHTLEISGKNTLRVSDILVGEVWVAGGQSNMEWPVGRAQDAAQETTAARFPRMRLFTVNKAAASRPKDDVSGAWVECSPDTVGGFSAVAYFFGRDVHRALDVPVGLIHSSWGGTPAESWMSREALTVEPAWKPMLDDLDRALADPDAARAYEKALDEWEQKNVVVDTGNEGVGRGWAKPELDDADWKTMEEPQYWEKAGLDLDGALWFRRTVEIPADWAGGDLVLTLGALDDYDTTYFGGVQVGATGRETPGYWTHPRRYVVPSTLVHAGRTVVAVRVFDRAGEGGFGGPGSAMRLDLATGAGKRPIALAGTWRYQIERGIPSLKPDWGSQPVAPDQQGAPTTLYNAMIAPLTPYATRGVIWYQGENNASRAFQYRALFRALIRDWRRAWRLGDFPFYFVQLANYMARHDQPGESEWAELREAQSMALAEPSTGLATAIDIGEAADIHPLDKQEVGRRLALVALARTYGQSGECSGPVYRSHAVEGAKARLRFEHAAGLATRDQATPKGFAIAGEDRRFVWAQAQIDGDSIVVWSDAVAVPVAVRYAWADNPDANLVNGTGLPALPFRTDDWPGITQH